ncbi:MAG: lipid A biosynthesis lauroyl acyltransferase [Rhodospirillales bacterium]
MVCEIVKVSTGNTTGVPWRRRLIHPLEALVAYAAFGVLRLLPFRAASALGGLVGRTIGPRLGITERARRNLGRAFPEKTAPGIERIILGMWDNLGRTVCEYPHLDRLRFSDDGGGVDVVGTEHVDALRDDGRPGIFFSAHMANWEIAALSIAHRGLPIHVIYRAPNNPLVELLFQRRHPGAGELIPKGAEGARRALALMRKGEHLGMFVDQKLNDGIPVPFFGRDAMTAPALARFALKFDCPVVPVRVERLHGSCLRITHYPPIDLPRTGDRQADVAATMAKVNAVIEGWVRERPEQWLWLHNRWPD